MFLYFHDSVKVTVTELVKGTVTYFPCDQWLDKDEGDGQIRRQLMATKKSTDKRKGTLSLGLFYHNG